MLLLRICQKNRQTLLFSATQTKSIKDLARLSLNKSNTEYISVHESEIVPQQLSQTYIICQLYEKVDILFSFVKKHLKSKIMCFASTMKQVSFLTKVFKQMAVGIKVFGLSGGMSQNVRREQYEGFCAAKSAIMFATDVAARGLDFPRIDLVFQLDIPISTAVYIHRIGRTARNNAHGKSVSLITPQEEGFLTILKNAKLDDIKEMKLNPKHLFSIKDQLSAIISHDPKLKYLAMKYFESYLKHINKNLNSIKINTLELPLDEFAQRLGLAEKPTVQLKSKDKIAKEIEQAKLYKLIDSENDDTNSDEEETETVFNVEAGSSDSDSDSSSSSDTDSSDSESDGSIVNDSSVSSDFEEDEKLGALLEKEKEKKKRKNKIEKLINRNKDATFSKNNYALVGAEEESDGEFFTVKRTNSKLTKEEEEELKYAMRINKKKLLKNEEFAKHILFTKDQETNSLKKLSKFEALVKELKEQSAKEIAEEQNKYAKSISEQIENAEPEDKKLQKQRLKEKRKKQKEEEREIERMRKMIEDIEYSKDNDPPPISSLGAVTIGGDGDDDETVEVEVENNPYKQMLDEYGAHSDSSSDEETESEDGGKASESEDSEAELEALFSKKQSKTQSNSKKRAQQLKMQEEQQKYINEKQQNAKRSFEQLMQQDPNLRQATPVAKKPRGGTSAQSSDLPEEELALHLLDQIY